MSYSGPSISIPDNNPTGVDVYVEASGLGVLTDLEFRFDALPGCDGAVGNPNAAISHSFVGDLIITVTAPDGAPTVVIVNRPGPAPSGSAANNFCAVLLDDDGGYPSIGGITLGNSDFVTGNFAPQSPLAAFAGENPNGSWKIKVSDNAGIDTGTLNRFSLILHTIPVPQIVVDVIGDPFPDGCTPGSCSLREAINLANAQPGLDRILLPASTQLQLTRAGANEDNNFTGDLDILDEVEIIGAGPTQTALTQTSADRLFEANGPWRNLTLRNLRLQGGSQVAFGGAVRVNGSSRLTIEDAELIGNRATFKGGAVHFKGFADDTGAVSASFRRVRFDDNQALDPSAGPSFGGAIYVIASGADTAAKPIVTIHDSQFVGNRAYSGGGAVVLDAVQSFSANHASIRNSEFAQNEVSGSGGGGAIGVTVDEFGVMAIDVEQSVFTDNRVVGLDTASRGGAIASGLFGTRISASLFDGNFARSAGAVYFTNGEIIDSTLCNNSAVDAGGAVYAASNQVYSAAIRRSTLCSNAVTTTNAAQAGGGAIAVPSGFLTLERSTLTGNIALRGGAIALGSGDLILTSNTMDAPTQPAGALGSLLRHNGTSNADVLRFSSNILVGQCSYANAIIPDGAFFNIESAGNTCKLTQATIAASNQVSVVGSAINLGALANNGGPTSTRMPIAPSVAINSGYTFACTPLDQRGYARTDTQCDVGSVEVGAIADYIFKGGFD
ncbi:MAG: choice-of-anchor Q domain-containing protein [Dokdonella sp.]